MTSESERIMALLAVHAGIAPSEARTLNMSLVNEILDCITEKNGG